MSIELASSPAGPLADVAFATAGGLRGAMHIDSPAGLLNLVPYLLGFHPDNSAVIIGAKGPRSSVHVTQRLPLPEGPATRRLAGSSAECAVRLLASQDCSRAFVVGYGPQAHVDPFAGCLRDQAARHGIAVPEILRATGQRYWSYVCSDPGCCPAEGTPYELTPDPGLACLLPAGAAGVLASRDGLAAQLTSVTAAEGSAARRATRRAEARIARLLEHAPASAGELSGRALAAAEGTTAVQAAFRRGRRQSGEITPGEAAWLSAVLRHIRVRDDMWSRLEPVDRKENLRLLLGLTRLAAPGYRAAPAALLAFVAWQCGNGTLANLALDQALADDPHYRAAHTLRQIVNLGLHPRLARVPLTPEQIAEIYANQGSRQ